MITFRYGYGWLERSLLLLWTLAWTIGLIAILVTGSVNWGEGQEVVTYTRENQPVAYWIIATVTLAVCILGFALTFEWNSNTRDTSDKRDKHS